MDESSRITITVCGDGGCGMRSSPASHQHTRLMRRDIRKELHNIAPRAQSMDVGIRSNDRYLHAPRPNLGYQLS
jgi:hypothetical protein